MCFSDEVAVGPDCVPVKLGHLCLSAVPVQKSSCRLMNTPGKGNILYGTVIRVRVRV